MVRDKATGKKMKIQGKRVFYMLFGIFLIGIAVGAYRIAGFGVDPFTCMNLAISKYLGMSFGNWQLIMNIAVLIVVFFTVRHCIGMGTVINMVFVGYIADFVCWIVQEQLSISVVLPLRFGLLAVAMLLLTVGAAMYMAADMGIAPYDSVAFIVMKLTKDKVSFKAGRVGSDVTVMVVGVIFSLIAGNSIWTVVGLGTVLNCLFNGPLIQFFRVRLEKNL